eukprot:2917466-Rhodomonas_salina.1
MVARAAQSVPVARYTKPFVITHSGISPFGAPRASDARALGAIASRVARRHAACAISRKSGSPTPPRPFTCAAPAADGGSWYGPEPSPPSPSSVSLFALAAGGASCLPSHE